MYTINDIPNELIAGMVLICNVKDILTAMKVSKKFHAAISDDYNCRKLIMVANIWRNVCVQIKSINYNYNSDTGVTHRQHIIDNKEINTKYILCKYFGRNTLLIDSKIKYIHINGRPCVRYFKIIEYINLYSSILSDGCYFKYTYDTYIDMYQYT